MISRFIEEYRFLSNFWYVDIVYDNVYPTTEHFFQAMKSVWEEERATIAIAPSPGLAKKLGRTVSLRADWEQIKLQVMELALRKKFSYPDLARKLVSTYPHRLVEGNYWGDEIWGVNLETGKGTNYLGELLIQVRTALINGIPLLPGPEPIF